MKKRWTALVLALSMVCALVLPAHAEEPDYRDVVNHYARNAIELWSSYGVLQGYPDGSFRPDGKITRAEMATVLDRVMGYRNVEENTFTDLPDGKWYTDYLLRAAAEGVFKGNPDGTMKPNEPITRQEAFAALSRVLNIEESDEPTGFQDDASIAGWARGYVSAMKQAGYIQGDQKGNIRAGDPITRAEMVTILNRMARAFVNEDGTYSRDCKGNLIVNAQDVTLKDMTIEGDLIVADGVGDGDVYLDKVTVKGDIVLRGCGENSFHILPGSKVKNIIVTKTTGGRIRLVNESGETIPMVYIDDGVGGVTLDGGALGNVVVTCDAQVTIGAMSVKTLSVAGSANVTVEKGSTVARAELGAAAKGASLTVKGKVTTLANDAGAVVNNKGTIGPGGGESSAGGGSSFGSGSLPNVISKVMLQLLAPRFGEIPDTADVMGVGYTAETKWLNADGSPASYRWKENGGDADTFTAGQAYQAIVTLTPNSGYSFSDKLQVEVTDGKDTPTSYTPAEVVVSGKGREVKLVYDKTEDKDPVTAVSIVAPEAVNLGERAKLSVGYWNNLIEDPASFAYQWYRCDDAEGGGRRPIAGAEDKEYTTSAEDTQNGGQLHFCCEVIVGGKAYPSGVKTVEVRNAVDPDTLPAPSIASEYTVTEDGRYVQVKVSDLMKHRDVSYDVNVLAEVKNANGTVLGNGVGPSIIFLDEQISDGEVIFQIDLVGLIGGFIPMENDMAFSSDLELGVVTVTVVPRIRGTQVPDKNQEQTFELTGTGIGKFYIYTYETPDEVWKGPPRDLQFLICDSGKGPYGAFVDKSAPDSDPVSAEKYLHLDIIFGTKADWKDGYYQECWDGEVYIWRDWLDGFETTDSKAEVRCAFYESNSPDDGMNIYYIKIKGQDIIFDLDNS